jgi:hypothetical protein
MSQEEDLDAIEQYNRNVCEKAKDLFYRLRNEIEELPYYTPNNIRMAAFRLPPFSAPLYKIQHVQNELINIKASLESAAEEVERICNE